MLQQLHIRRFAIIDTLELELEPGMTALTGETGAGKSILLDALALALGGRASADAIAEGADRAEISARFDITGHPAVADWLAAEDLDDEEDAASCVLRRVVSRNGKSRASINGRPVTARSLVELGERLVRIHGQHQHQSLGRSTEQRELLDRLVDPDLTSSVAHAFDAWQEAVRARDEHQHRSRDAVERIDLLNYQLQEFDGLELGGASVAELEQEHRWLANLERVLALATEAGDMLDLAAEPLGGATRPLESLAELDERLREALDLVESAGIQVEEAASLVRRHTSQLEHDDARLAWLDERLAVLTRLARKHGVDPDALDGVETRLRGELDALSAPEWRDAELETVCRQAAGAYETAADRLRAGRIAAAAVLDAKVTSTMQELGMDGGRFEIAVVPLEARAAHGSDRVEFRVRPNAGQVLAPLARIASGGELSRISLALQLATLDAGAVPTLLFDEVDSGVSGAVAESVGRLLRRVGAAAQVLTVTHLPQVAAQAHQHFRVSKTGRAGRTVTEVSSLDATATRDEIARMLGGARLTKKSRQHAQEMLDLAVE